MRLRFLVAMDGILELHVGAVGTKMAASVESPSGDAAS